MPTKIKMTVFFTGGQDMTALYRLANSLADLELSIYSDFSKYTKLRILLLEANGGVEVELWVYYGAVTTRDSVPAVITHEAEGFVIIGEEVVPKYVLEYRKPVIWFKERTGAAPERKAANLTTVHFSTTSDDNIKTEFNDWFGKFFLTR